MPLSATFFRVPLSLGLRGADGERQGEGEGAGYKGFHRRFCLFFLWLWKVSQPLAATTVISTSTDGRASSAWTVVRLGAWPVGNHWVQTSFRAAKSRAMSFR